MLKSIFLEEKDESCALFKDGNKVTIKTTTLTLGMAPLLTASKEFSRLTLKLAFDVEMVCGNRFNPTCFAAAIHTAIGAEKVGLPYQIWAVNGTKNGRSAAHAFVLIDGPNFEYKFLSWGRTFETIQDMEKFAATKGFVITDTIGIYDDIASFIKDTLSVQLPK